MQCKTQENAKSKKYKHWEEDLFFHGVHQFYAGDVASKVAMGQTQEDIQAARNTN